MLELFIYSTTQNLLVGIVTLIVAALKRFGGHSAGIDTATPQTPSSERRGGGQNVPA